MPTVYGLARAGLVSNDEQHPHVCSDWLQCKQPVVLSRSNATHREQWALVQPGSTSTAVDKPRIDRWQTDKIHGLSSMFWWHSMHAWFAGMFWCMCCRLVQQNDPRMCSSAVNHHVTGQMCSCLPAYSTATQCAGFVRLMHIMNGLHSRPFVCRELFHSLRVPVMLIDRVQAHYINTCSYQHLQLPVGLTS